MDARIRLTLAIRIPEQLSPVLQEIQQILRRKSMVDLRFTSPGEFFVPLIAMGEQPGSCLARLDAVLGPVFHYAKPLTLNLAGLGGQPNPSQPRIIAAGLGGDLEGLELLANVACREALKAVQLPEGRVFSPSVALVRLRMESEQARGNLGRALKLTQFPVTAAFTATEAQLLQSTAAEGVTYETLRTFEFKGG